MNKEIKLFLKYAEHHPVKIGNINWQTQQNRYCVGLDCSDCILNFHSLDGTGSHYLNDSQVTFVKEMYPEYFL